MGCYVHLHVCFACDHNDAVAQLAKEHLTVMGEEYDKGYARCFLEHLSQKVS